MANFLKKIASVLLFSLTLLLLWLFSDYFHAYGLTKTELIKWDNDISDYQSNSISGYCQKTKFMFSKNIKVAGTTISSILIQIASHYHKYKIFNPSGFKAALKVKDSNHGYLVSHMPIRSLKEFKKVFPKNNFLWISTTRKVADQVNSYIKLYHLQNFYRPSNFHKILKNVRSGRKKVKGSQAFHNGGTSMILYECRHKEKEFEKFKSCALNVFKEFDLIIPVDRLNEGLIMLHKMTCLPLSDFAYTNKKISSSEFEVSAQNMSEILKYHERSIWFYNYSSAEFDKRFQKFQSEFCESVNCRTEIEQLKQENEKLEESCGLNRKEKGKFVGFNYDWKKLARNHSLALRCLSFALEGNSKNAFRMYNYHLNRNDKTVVGRIASDWMKIMKKQKFYAK